VVNEGEGQGEDEEDEIARHQDDEDCAL